MASLAPGLSLSLRRLRVLAIAWYVRRSYTQAEKAAQKIRQQDQRDAFWAATHERLARFVREHIVKMRGLWIKFGQFMSTQQHLLPEPWKAELAQLQDALPPRPVSEIKRTLREEFRAIPRRALSCCRRADAAGGPFGPFAYFESTPLASASIAQVHRATLKDGRKVVVKIQHRGIAEIMDLDVSLVKELLGWVKLTKTKVDFDFRTVIEEWCKETKKELDFLHEAENADRIAARLTADPTVRAKIPAVVRQPDQLMPKRRVLILEYIDGVKPKDMKDVGADPGRVLQDLAGVFARQIFHDGLFHADPHPGNILIERQSNLPVLLDFGLTKEVADEVRVCFARVVVATATGDSHGLLVALRELGLLRNDLKDPTHAMEAAQKFLRGPRVSAYAIGVETPASAEVVQPATSSKESQQSPLQHGVAHDVDVVQPAPTVALAVTPNGAVSQHVSSVLCEKTSSQEKADTAVDQNQSLQEHLDWKLVGSRYPIESTPGSFIFVLRVVSCLRGIAASVGLGFDAVHSFYPAARRAIRRAAQIRWSAAKPALGKSLSLPAQVRLGALVGRLLEETQVLGISAAVFSQGDLLACCAAGDLGPGDASPVTDDTLFGVFSCGSALSALLVHCLADTGDVALEEQVARYWDKFRCHGKGAVTVRELLEHRAGLAAFAGRSRSWNGVASFAELSRWDRMLELLAEAKRTEHEAPGGLARFHVLSHGWLCSAVADRATCISYPALVQERITEPLGLTGHIWPMLPPYDFSGRLAACGVDDDLAQQWPNILSSHGPEEAIPADAKPGSDQRQRNLGIIAQMLSTPSSLNDPALQRAMIPAVNTRCTALGLAAVFAALAGNGAVEGRGRVLSEKYCRWLQQEVQSASDSEASWESWPLGFHQMHFRRDDGSVRRGAFGAFALGGCLVFSDPATNTAAAILVNELTKEAHGVKAILRLLAELLPELGECILDGRDAYDCMWWEKPYCNPIHIDI